MQTKFQDTESSLVHVKTKDIYPVFETDVRNISWNWTINFIDHYQ